MQQGKSQPTQELPLQGARVLVIEDEYCIADDLRRELRSAGAQIVGPVSTVAMANRLIDEGQFDCAVVDLNLHGDSAVPVAQRLAREGRPYAIATGYGAEVVPDELKSVPRIEKPFDPRTLVEVVRQLGCAKSQSVA